MIEVGGYLREPSKDSLRKATILSLKPTTIFYPSGNIAEAGSGYFVMGLAPQMLSLSDYLDITHFREIVAVWLDQLDTRTTFVHSWMSNVHERTFFDSCSYHASLWEAEIEALTRPRRLIYNVRSGEHFTP